LKSVKAVQAGVSFACYLGTYTLDSRLEKGWLTAADMAVPPQIVTVDNKQILNLTLYWDVYPRGDQQFSPTLGFQVILVYPESAIQSESDKLLVKDLTSGQFIAPGNYTTKKIDLGDFIYERGGYSYSAAYNSQKDVQVCLGNQDTGIVQAIQNYSLYYPRPEY